ncbi:MAG: prepilin peptidase [Candidatus Pacebacteria bacterium]|nr:prepilin peptidase [Candidatus Paceibacterota bacterium]
MTIFFGIVFAALGAIVASFTAVIAERIYTGQAWWKGRSRCNSCRRPLAAADLVPIFSWLAFRGRCRTCHSRIPAIYTLFETAMAVCFAFAYLLFGLSLQLILFLAALAVLGFIVVYDLRHTIVPAWSSTALIAVAVLFDIVRPSTVPTFLTNAGVSILIGLGFFLLYALSRGRAMGLGDTPVAFALALLAGNQAFAGLMFSFWIGAVIGILILVMRRGGPTMGIEVPFVPFLAAGFLLAIFTQWNPFLF